MCIKIRLRFSILNYSTYIRYAGTSESKQPIGIVTLHNAQESCGSGNGETGSTAHGHQLKIKHLFSFLVCVIPDLHHKRFLPLILKVPQVTGDVSQICFRRLSVELVDLAAVQLRVVQADVLEEASVELSAFRIGSDEH